MFERITYKGEEYEVRPIDVLTGYPERYLEGASEEKKKEFFESLETAIASFICSHLIAAGAVERTDTVNERGDTFIQCDALVLVKCRDSEGAVPEDPKRSSPHTRDT